MSNNLIAIYPNSIGFGYVVRGDNGILINYGMVAISPVDNEKCLKRIDRIIEYYKSKTLVLESSISKKKSRVKKLIRKISKRDDVKIFKYTEIEVRDVFELYKAKNKYERSRKIAEVYTELETKLPEKRKEWESENYYQAIFDAMALMLTYSHFEEY